MTLLTPFLPQKSKNGRVKIKLTGSKGHTSVRIYQKWSKWRIFGHKMMSYVKIGVRYGKKVFFNIIYSYYRVISYVLFVGKNKVNRVKRPYICSNWPKMAKMASFLATKWRHMSKLGWVTTKNFFSTLP